MKILNLRLSPGQDLKKEIANFCQVHHLQAATLLSGVGSLQEANLRLAGSDKFFVKKEKFEVVSLTGTCSQHGIHLHMSIANSDGAVIGGHLMDGNLIYTTAELVFLEQSEVVFTREHDLATGFKELAIRSK